MTAAVHDEQQHSAANAAQAHPPVLTQAAAVSEEQQPSTSDPPPLPPTHLLSLPLHLICSILTRVPRAASVGAFLATCKTAHDLNDVPLLADWLLQHRGVEGAISRALDGSGPQGDDSSWLSLTSLTQVGYRSDPLMAELVSRPSVQKAAFGMVPAFGEGGIHFDQGVSQLVRTSGVGFCLTVRKILELGLVDPEASALFGGETPLQAASSNGHASVVAELLNAGVNVANTGRDVRQPSALHLAAGNGRTEVVRMLIASGAAVNARDAEGNTPLHAALDLFFVGPEAIHELLRHPQIDTTVRNESGDTPLDLARKRGFDSIVALLEQHARSTT